MSNTTGRKWEIYVQIYSTNSIPRTRKNLEKVWPENSNQKLITKYPAPKAQKTDVAKTTIQTKYRLEVAVNSIIQIMIVTWDMR
jgi:hypothetical protein